jgi:hypothetical protein
MDQFAALLKAITADEFNKVVLGVVALVSLVVSPVVQWIIARRQYASRRGILSRRE